MQHKLLINGELVSGEGEKQPDWQEECWRLPCRSMKSSLRPLRQVMNERYRCGCSISLGDRVMYR